MDEMSDQGNSKLVDEILDARTASEAATARQKALAHLEEHPDDMAVRQAMEQLAMIQLAQS